MTTSIPASIEAAKVAAQAIELICRSPHIPQSGRPFSYRSPEQISLIVDLVNIAMDAMLPLDVASVEEAAEPINFDENNISAVPLVNVIEIKSAGDFHKVLDELFKKKFGCNKGDLGHECQGN